MRCPIRSEKTPSGRPQAATAFWMTRPTSSEVPGCAGCDLATTGQPAASADAVSDQKREDALGQAAGGDGFLDDAADEFRGAGVCGVRLGDDRPAGGECR